MFFQLQIQNILDAEAQQIAFFIGKDDEGKFHECDVNQLRSSFVEIRDESHAMQWSIFCDNASNHTDDPETKRNFRAQAAMLRNAKFEPDHRVLIYQVNEALECAKSAAYRLTTGDYSGAAAQLQDIRYNLNQWNENLPDETRVSEV